MKFFRVIFSLIVISLIWNAGLFAAISDGSTVSAPLDGGLLTILGAAGVMYYIARRKRSASKDLRR